MASVVTESKMKNRPRLTRLKRATWVPLELAEKLADRLKLRGRARGVVLGAYPNKRGTYPEPICSFDEIVRMSESMVGRCRGIDLLKRPGCGRKTFRVLMWAIKRERRRCR